MFRLVIGLYEDTKRLFPAEKDGKKVLIGNINKLKQKKGVNADDIKVLDMSNAMVSVTFSMEQLFASKEMLRTIAKIAYEWHCYIHDINCYISEDYQDIVDCILLKNPVEDFVEICVDNNLEYLFSVLCNVGSHGLFEYIDVDGYKYVIFDFWGIVCYKVRICKVKFSNQDNENIFNMYVYGIDGEKSQKCFGAKENPQFMSMSAAKAIQTFPKVYNKKLDQLIKTTFLTLAKMKQLVEELRKAFKIYKQEPHNFARFVDYESNDRVLIIRILLLLCKHEKEYSFEINFNDNLKALYEIGDSLVFTEEENIEYLKQLLKLHEKDQLATYIENGIAFFDKIYEHETTK